MNEESQNKTWLANRRKRSNFMTISFQLLPVAAHQRSAENKII